MGWIKYDVTQRRRRQWGDERESERKAPGLSSRNPANPRSRSRRGVGGLCVCVCHPSSATKPPPKRDIATTTMGVYIYFLIILYTIFYSTILCFYNLFFSKKIIHNLYLEHKKKNVALCTPYIYEVFSNNKCMQQQHFSSEKHT